MASRTLPLRIEPQRLPAAWPFRRCDWRLGDRPVVHMHRHEVLELGLCRSGCGTYLVEDKEMRFAPGDALVIGPGEMHWSRSDPGSESRWTYLFADPLRLLAGVPDCGELLRLDDLAGPGFANVLARDRHPGLVDLIARLADIPVRSDATGRAEARGLLLAVMAGLHRLPGRGAAPRRGDGAERLAPALRTIADRFREEIGMPALARACGMGETTFRRAFRAAFGCAPKAYVLRLRLAHAEALRLAGASVTQSALESGFGSLSAFRRQRCRRPGT